MLHGAQTRRIHGGARPADGELCETAAAKYHKRLAVAQACLSLNTGMADHPEREIYLIRHGETEWARDGRHTGRTDVRLTELGRSQAVAAGRKITGQGFAEGVSSPLSRALDTARNLGFGPRGEAAGDPRGGDYRGGQGR